MQAETPTPRVYYFFDSVAVLIKMKLKKELPTQPSNSQYILVSHTNILTGFSGSSVNMSVSAGVFEELFLLLGVLFYCLVLAPFTSYSVLSIPFINPTLTLIFSTQLFFCSPPAALQLVPLQILRLCKVP